MIKMESLLIAFVIAFGFVVLISNSTPTEEAASKIIPIRLNDEGIKYPDELPIAGRVQWEEPLPGFFAGLAEVWFHDQLVDRIMFLKIDPEHYSFAVHCDKNLQTIEQWQNSLDAVAVINGSFYQRDDYGEPYVPMMIRGERRGLNPYKSSHGAILFEPVHPDSPWVKVIDYKEGRIANIEDEGYSEGTASYPTLVDFDGKVRAKGNPKWRASRSFIGLDRDGFINGCN